MSSTRVAENGATRPDAKRRRWEERRDSNPRPPGPQPGALPLRHAPHAFPGTPGRIRTSGPRLRRPLLCPLSYGRMRASLKRVRLRSTNPRCSERSDRSAASKAGEWRRSLGAETPGRLAHRSQCASGAQRCQWQPFARLPRSRERLRCVRTPRRERKTGIEPASLAWKARALPLSYSRVSERPDSNRRPQRPERCALTKLRHSPKAALVAAGRR